MTSEFTAFVVDLVTALFSACVCFCSERCESSRLLLFTLLLRCLVRASVCVRACVRACVRVCVCVRACVANVFFVRFFFFFFFFLVVLIIIVVVRLFDRSPLAESSVCNFFSLSLTLSLSLYN